MLFSAPVNSEPLVPIKTVVQQAPPTYIETDVPVTAIGVVGQPVGTSVNSRPNSILWIKEPMTPKTAVLGTNQVPTTSLLDPDSPAPVPAVGAFPKLANVTPVGKNLAAPKSRNTRTLGIIVAGILLAWFFLGFSFRSVL